MAEEDESEETAAGLARPATGGGAIASEMTDAEVLELFNEMLEAQAEIV